MFDHPHPHLQHNRGECIIYEKEAKDAIEYVFKEVSELDTEAEQDESRKRQKRVESAVNQSR